MTHHDQGRADHPRHHGETVGPHGPPVRLAEHLAEAVVQLGQILQGAVPERRDHLQTGEREEPKADEGTQRIRGLPGRTERLGERTVVRDDTPGQRCPQAGDQQSADGGHCCSLLLLLAANLNTRCGVHEFPSVILVNHALSPNSRSVPPPRCSPQA